MTADVRGVATVMKFGTHSNYAPTLIEALKSELGIPASAQTHDIKALVMELARVHGVALSYVGESYGFRVKCEDEASLAFTKIFALRHGLTVAQG